MIQFHFPSCRVTSTSMRWMRWANQQKVKWAWEVVLIRYFQSSRLFCKPAIAKCFFLNIICSICRKVCQKLAWKSVFLLYHAFCFCKLSFCFLLRQLPQNLVTRISSTLDVSLLEETQFERFPHSFRCFILLLWMSHCRDQLSLALRNYNQHYSAFINVIPLNYTQVLGFFLRRTVSRNRQLTKGAASPVKSSTNSGSLGSCLLSGPAECFLLPNSLGKKFRLSIA